MKERLCEYYAALKRRKILFFIFLFVIINVFSVGLELFFYNGSSLFAGKYMTEYLLRDLRSEEQENGTNSYFIELPQKVYIKQVQIDYSIQEKVDYTVSYGVYNAGEYDNYENIQDNLYPYFNQVFTNVFYKTDRIKIVLPSSVEGQKTFKVRLTNYFGVNSYRILFFDLVLGLLCAIYLCRKNLVSCLEYIYLLFSLGFGIWMICLLPLGGWLTWDNEIHFQNIYFISQGRDVEVTEIAQMMIERNDYPRYNTYEEKKMIFDFVSRDSPVIQTIQKTNGFIPYNQRAYCAAAFGLKIGEILQVPFGYCICFAKFMNLLQYVILIFLAVHFSKINKILPFVCGSIPTLLFQAASFSYDAYVAGFLILGITLLLGEIFGGDGGVSKKRVFAGIIAIVFGSFAKAVYIPLLLLVLLLPGKGRDNAIRNVKAAAVIVMCIVLSTFVTNTVSQTIRGGNIEGDSRGGNTNVTLQLKEMISDPVDYGKVLISDMGGNVGEFFFGWYILSGYYYFEDVYDYEKYPASHGNYYYATVFLVFFLALTVGNYTKLELKWKDRIKIALTVLCVCVLIWTALYLSFTAVGMTEIKGVQPRYYLPMFILLLFSMQNKTVSIKWSENRYYMFICLILLFCQAGGIYNVMLTNNILNYAI